MNELLLCLEVVVCFGMILVMKKLFGSVGLYVWIGLAAAIANIQVVKSVNLFGIEATLGNVLFASVFLATDILRECYGKEAAKKGVGIGVASVLIFLACTQISLAFIPASIDIAHSSMAGLFTLTPRVAFASLTMFALANLLDVYIYNKLYEKTGGKLMWLRNNVSTVLCNCFENFGFVLLAFWGLYGINDLLIIALSTCLIEAGIALCDTPFLYLAVRTKEPTCES